MNKYQKTLSKSTKKDISEYPNISYYSAKKFNKKLFNRFKSFNIHQIYKIINKKED